MELDEELRGKDGNGGRGPAPCGLVEGREKVTLAHQDGRYEDIARQPAGSRNL